MARCSFQLTGLDHSSAASSPFVSVLDIIDAQAPLLHILFHHLIPRLFRSSSLYMFWNSFFPLLLIKFVSSILSRCPSRLSLISSRWFFISSKLCLKIIPALFVFQVILYLYFRRVLVYLLQITLPFHYTWVHHVSKDSDLRIFSW